MRLVKQPPGSSCCGQACVAMICGISLKKSCKEFGHDGATRRKDLIIVLEKHGFKCGKLKRKAGRLLSIYKTYIVTFRLNGASGYHWMIWHEGKYYDPAKDIWNWKEQHGRICSYMEVTR